MSSLVFVFTFPHWPLNIFGDAPDIHSGDIYYNAVGSLGEERGNGTGTGSGESMESKLEQIPAISSVEVCIAQTRILA